MSFPMPMGGPFIGGVNLPSSGVDIHFHGPDHTTLTGGYLKVHGSNQPAGPRYLNGYECAMADLHAHQMGLKRY